LYIIFHRLPLWLLLFINQLPIGHGLAGHTAFEQGGEDRLPVREYGRVVPKTEFVKIVLQMLDGDSTTVHFVEPYFKTGDYFSDSILFKLGCKDSGMYEGIVGGKYFQGSRNRKREDDRDRICS